jgi:hypothetical protein
MKSKKIVCLKSAAIPLRRTPLPPFPAACRPVLIGSLPGTDHRQAMQLITAHSPEIPLWPQLPKLPREGMIRQFLSGFPGLVEEDGKFWVAADREDFPEKMTSFYEEYLAVSAVPDQLGTSRFALGRDTAPGFFTLLDSLESSTRPPFTVKGQVTGPITAGIGLKDHLGHPVIYDDNLRDILIKLLALKGRWQAAMLQRCTGSMPPLIFIDEPGMVGFGAGGFDGISAEMVKSAVNRVIDEIHAGGGLAGIHICANGDWGPALDSTTDIISFDAYSYFDNFILYREPLCRFLRRGGILAWGIIPTGDPQAVLNESTTSLFARWLEQLDRLAALGFSRRQLMSQTLIAPSCGTGSLLPELAEKVLAMTSSLSTLARKALAQTEP